MALGEGMRMILGKWSRDQMRRHIVTLCVACPLGSNCPKSVKPKAPAGCPVLAAWCRTQCSDQWCRYEAPASTGDCSGRQAQKSWWVTWLTSYSLPVLWSLDKQGISSLFHACMSSSLDEIRRQERVTVPKWTFPSILRDFQVWEGWIWHISFSTDDVVTSVYDYISFSRIGELAVHLWFVESSKKRYHRAFGVAAWVSIFNTQVYHFWRSLSLIIGNPPGHMVTWRKSRWKQEDTERALNDDVGRKECDLMPGLGRGNIRERKLVVNHQVVGWDSSRCDDGPRIYHLV